MKYSEGKLEPSYWAQAVYFNGKPVTRAFVESKLRAAGIGEEHIAQFQDTAVFYNPYQRRDEHGEWVSDATKADKAGQFEVMGEIKKKPVTKHRIVDKDGDVWSDGHSDFWEAHEKMMEHDAEHPGSYVQEYEDHSGH